MGPEVLEVVRDKLKRRHREGEASKEKFKIFGFRKNIFKEFLLKMHLAFRKH
jgi:hypothetical protein